MKENKKDFWDKLKIVSGILIPVAIAYVGHIFASKQHETELVSQEIQFEHHKQISTINAKVGQVKLVSSFFDALLSDSPKGKKLAIQSILIALPEEGPKLVRIVSESDEESELKEFAKESLSTKRRQIVSGLFSEDKSEILDAYKKIIAGWKDDPEVIPIILELGNDNLANKDGIYNALVTLSHLKKSNLGKYSSSIIEFSYKTEKSGEKIKKRAEKLRSRIPAPDID